MKFTPEHRANISRGKKGSIPHNKGKNISEAQIRSLSLVHQVLTSGQVHEVRALLMKKKVTQRVIARMFNVSPATITRIKQGYIYYTEKES
jgi:hypothetical protein